MKSFLDQTQAASNPIVARLEHALLPGSDFPISAQVAKEVSHLTSSPDVPIDRLVDAVKNDPTLTARVIHAANRMETSDRLHRFTLNQAIMHLGMRSLDDICNSHVLIHNFGEDMDSAHYFADSLRRALMVAALSEQLAQQAGSLEGRNDAFIAGLLSSIGPVLLAYYFPKAIQAATERATMRKRQLSQGIFEVVGISPLGLSLLALQHLSIPEYYRTALRQAAQALTAEKGSSGKPRIDKQSHWLVPVITTAGQVVEGICSPNAQGSIQSRVQELGRRAGFSNERVEQFLTAITDTAAKRSLALGLKEDVQSEPSRKQGGKSTRESAEATQSPRVFSPYIQQLEKVIDEQESLTTILTTALEALVFGERCDRALLLLPNKRASKLQGKMCLGKPFPAKAEEIERPINPNRPDLSPDIRAFQEGRIITTQTQLYGPGGWAVGIPIGTGERRLGVLYAESRPSTENQARSDNLKAIVSLLDRAAKELPRSGRE